MVHTVIIPSQELISFSIPKDYIGKEIEIIAFARGEGMHAEKSPEKKARFTVFHVDNPNYKFDRDEANER